MIVSYVTQALLNSCFPNVSLFMRHVLKGIPRCQHMFGLYCLKWKENIYSSSLLTKRSVCLKFYKFSSCFSPPSFRNANPVFFQSTIQTPFRKTWLWRRMSVSTKPGSCKQGEKCLSTLISSNPSGNIKKKQTLRLMTSGKISKTV